MRTHLHKHLQPADCRRHWQVRRVLRQQEFSKTSTPLVACAKAYFVTGACETPSPSYNCFHRTNMAMSLPRCSSQMPQLFSLMFQLSRVRAVFGHLRAHFATVLEMASNLFPLSRCAICTFAGTTSIGKVEVLPQL